MDSNETPKRTINGLIPQPHGGALRTSGPGRPKGSRNRSTVIKEFLEAKTTEKNPYTDENMTVLQKMTLSIIAKAMSGDVMAFNTIMDNCYGKLKDKIEVENTLDENNPLNLMKLEDLEEIAIVARRTRQPNRA
jgi:hypothetical protein